MEEYVLEIFGSVLPRCFSGKEFACQCRRHRRLGFDLWISKIPLEKGTASRFSILAEKMPGLEPMRSKRVEHDSHAYTWVDRL